MITLKQYTIILKYHYLPEDIMFSSMQEIQISGSYSHLNICFRGICFIVSTSSALYTCTQCLLESLGVSSKLNISYVKAIRKPENTPSTQTILALARFPWQHSSAQFSRGISHQVPSSLTANPPLPSAPLNHIPECHIYTHLTNLQGW